jgi:hypothetical protein
VSRYNLPPFCFADTTVNTSSTQQETEKLKD